MFTHADAVIQHSLHSIVTHLASVCTVHIMHTKTGRLKCVLVWEITVGTFVINRCLPEIFSCLYNQLFAHTNCDLVFHDSTNITDISKCFTQCFLSSCVLPAIPPGLIIQVDGEKRGADSLCGGQWYLP